MFLIMFWYEKRCWTLSSNMKDCKLLNPICTFFYFKCSVLLMMLILLISGVAFYLMMLTTSINSCCNPFIYLCFSSKQIKRILPCCENSDIDVPNHRRGPYLIKDSTRPPVQHLIHNRGSFRCLNDQTACM